MRLEKAAKRVLVTGAGGFIGRQTIEPLRARGYEVHALGRSRPNVDSGDFGDIVWHMGDLMEPEVRIRLIHDVQPSHLLLLAWYTEYGLYWDSPLNARWLAASQDLVIRFAEAGGLRIVGAGTCAEYDWSSTALAKDNCVEEGFSCQPATSYGRAKFALGEWLTNTGVSSAWARLFFIYGPAEDPRRFIPSTILSLFAERPARIGPSWFVRDFLSSTDAGEALAMLLDSSMTGPFNIGTGTGHTLAEVAQRIGILLDRPALIMADALPARRGDPQRLVADMRRLRGALGFRPRVDLDAGLASAVEWWKKQIR